MVKHCVDRVDDALHLLLILLDIVDSEFRNVERPAALADSIENFYNAARRHSSLNYLTPNEFENLHLTQTQTTFS